MTEPQCIAAVVLAAGAATRMGRLKQLLPYRGRTLVAHAVEQAIEAEFLPVTVVTGAASEEVQAAVRTLSVKIVFNDAWQSGMGASIVAGMRHLQSRSPSAVAILLADQPLVAAYHLKEMSRLLQNGSAKIVAAEYNGTLGVPALFRREMFQQLLSLPPEAGARLLLRHESLHITAYPLPEAALDIDTPEDFAALEQQLNHNI